MQVRIAPEAEHRASAQRAFEDHRRRVLRVLPDAEVEHVGATSVPGALTKGDVDVLVRVSPERFETAAQCLRRLYVVHQPHNWTPTLASFVDPEADEIPVGIQLVVAGSEDDAMFGAFRDALTGDPALLAKYNDLKRRLDGEQYSRYTEIKGRFIERALGRDPRR
jgi:GrpB-like predicted nucleotidyltransferase (UPF0157 family)